MLPGANSCLVARPCRLHSVIVSDPRRPLPAALCALGTRRNGSKLPPHLFPDIVHLLHTHVLTVDTDSPQFYNTKN